MFVRHTILGLSILCVPFHLQAAMPKPASHKVVPAPHIGIQAGVAQAVASPDRKPENVARDKYRHPAQTLSFFGLRPDMTVIEIMPGGGWYSEILAPYLAAGGHYIAAVPPGKSTDQFQALLTAAPDRFGKVQMVTFTASQPVDLVAPGTADMVLTFRNIHNFLGSSEQPGDGNAPKAFATWFRALKPGGVLGIVEHRLPETMESALEKTSGYVKRSTVIRLAMAAGFQFAGASEINANPKDNHNHPKGVWTLPPTYELGDQDRAKYAAIGESDRMTLRFVKPNPNSATPANATPPATGAPQ